MGRPTPLYDRHLAASATMVDFSGFDMPLQYTSIRDEHMAVRQRAGIFDVSHMGEVELQGPTASETVQRLVTNDISRLVDGGALYAVMCNDSGGIVDDVIVYRISADRYMVVINAGCRDKDLAHMRNHVIAGTNLRDRSEELALLAVQGPRAVELIGGLSPTPWDDLASFHFTETTVAGIAVHASRTGYTGEDGLELYVHSDGVVRLWDALLEAGSARGLQPCGLGARDTLRLEAGLRLYGQDMDETTDPYSAGLGWTVKLDKGDFLGSDALRRLDPRSPPRHFVGLTLPERAIARHGQTVAVDGEPAGVITSGSFSFCLGHGIATASLRPPVSEASVISVDIRGTDTPATRTRLPFYRRTAPAAATHAIPTTGSGGH